jgi:hypothetical protein
MYFSFMVKNGQSAAKVLNIDKIQEQGSTTISWEESTTLNKLETADIS